MAFVKGQSGNPGGQPKAVAAVKKLALDACPDVIRELVRISKESLDERARVAAGKELLDRGLGRASQSVEVTGENGGPLIAIIRDKD